MDLDFLEGLLHSATSVEEEWDIAAMAIDAVFSTMDSMPPGPPLAPQYDPHAHTNLQSFVTPLPPRPVQQRDDDMDELDDYLDDVDGEIEAEPSTDVAALKRARHRQAMQRCRERKRYRMDHLDKKQRKKKQELRQQLHEFRMREEKQARLLTAAEKPLTKVEELRKLFAHAVHMKEALLDERQALEESIREQQKFERIVLQSTKHIVNDPMAKLAPMLSGGHHAAMPDDSMDEDASSSGQDSSTTESSSTTTTSRPRRKDPTGHWVQYLEDEPPLFYEPESTESIEEHIRECYQRVRRLQGAFDANVLGATDTYCLGWKAQHSITRTVDQKLELRFRFRRRVPLNRLSLEELQQASWKVMRDPVQNARLYSSLVVCKIVQFLGENTFIFLRNAPDKDKRLHIRYFSMHSQMEHRTSENERAFLTLMKIIDKDPHVLEPDEAVGVTKPPATPVIWLKEGTLFMHITEKLEDQQIEIEYGGAVHCPSEDHARYLMVEVGGILMRWEQIVVPQRLLPC